MPTTPWAAPAAACVQGPLGFGGSGTFCPCEASWIHFLLQTSGPCAQVGIQVAGEGILLGVRAFSSALPERQGGPKDVPACRSASSLHLCDGRAPRAHPGRCHPHSSPLAPGRLLQAVGSPGKLTGPPVGRRSLLPVWF